jgi:sulfur carrier protein ThiS
MRITVRPIGVIRNFTSGQELEVAQGLTSRQLMETLGIPKKLKMVSYVNGKKKDLDAELEDGDEIKLVTMLTGG